MAEQNLWICWLDAAAAARHASLPARLGLPACTGREALPDACRLVLWATPEDLSLGTWPEGPGHAAPTRVDFLDPALLYRLKTTGKRQGLGRALGLASHPAPFVLDATAGLGRDSLAMAALGCRVLLMERSAVIFALLEDGLARARAAADAELDRLLPNMELQQGEARDRCVAISRGEAPRPDVIYLDPMFPPRNKLARVKKDIALLHTLLGSEPDVDSLLDVALAAAGRRVVLKRPAGGKGPARRAADFTVEGKTASFDVYLCNNAARMPA